MSMIYKKRKDGSVAVIEKKIIKYSGGISLLIFLVNPWIWLFWRIFRRKFEYKTVAIIPAGEITYENNEQSGNVKIKTEPKEEVMKMNPEKFKIYQANSNVGVIIFSGIGGSVDGFENKYAKIAENLKEKHNVSVFIFAVESWNQFDSLLKMAMDKICEYYKSLKIEDFSLYAMGVSAGASILASNSFKYSQIKKVLAINPVLQMNYFKLLDGVKSFVGKMIFIFGENDKSAKYCPLLEKQDFKNVDFVIVKGADHQFTNNLKEFINLPETYLF